MGTPKLKSCPFCGASGEDIDFGTCKGRYAGYDYVQCTECGAEVRAHRGDDPAFKNAVEQWNRRAELTSRNTP